jgi:hypothetical protein
VREIDWFPSGVGESCLFRIRQIALKKLPAQVKILVNARGAFRSGKIQTSKKGNEQRTNGQSGRLKDLHDKYSYCSGGTKSRR